MTDITASQKTALLKLPGFKDIQKQYAKEMKMEGGGKKRMRGKGFWDDVGNWFYQAGQDINQFLKDSKIVSNIASYALPILGAMGGALLTVNPLGATAGGIAGKSTADYIKSQGYGAVHMMPNSMLMKGKTHGMKGKGLTRQSNGLIVNQTGRGVLTDIVGTFAPFAGVALNSGLDVINKTKKMRGGDARLVINPVGQRLMGKGLTRQSNGLIVNQKGGRKMRGQGAGTEYNTVSSAFGELVR